MRRLCVYCGSSPGADPVHREAAAALGVTLAEQEIALVYGGASVGVMGAIADATLAAGGKAFGVIPESLMDFEVAHAGLTELFVVESMHARKAKMAALSDGFVALPGGLGTLEELFEVLTWSQLRIHAKPCGLLNVNGYFDALLTFLDRAVDERFLRPEHRDTLIVAAEGDDLIDRLSAWTPTTIDKWWEAP